MTAVRPQGGELEVEAELEKTGLPTDIEIPLVVRAAAPLGAKLAAGTMVRLSANPADAFVFPCLDKVCRA